MHISKQPIALLPPAYEGLHSASEKPSARQAEPGTNEELTTDNEPPRRQLINRYWKGVSILTILLFVFTPARPYKPMKLDEDILLQMARRMNNLAVPCPKGVLLNI
jgi:hypothetical protein